MESTDRGHPAEDTPPGLDLMRAIPTGVSSHASEDVADAESDNDLHDVIEVSSEEENAQPESPEELGRWREQMKTALWDYLKDKQPLGAIALEQTA